MSGLILVAYATRYGSTQEVAEAVTATLRESGLEVDIQPIRKVRSLTGYKVIVLGAAIYYGLWHKDAVNFLTKNESALTQRPVA
ncbi:MAG: flavodoxin, partial [Anaerolineales bacterium]|nr:flavodoxin [Anaerolineales bacterium]